MYLSITPGCAVRPGHGVCNTRCKAERALLGYLRLKPALALPSPTPQLTEQPKDSAEPAPVDFEYTTYAFKTSPGKRSRRRFSHEPNSTRTEQPSKGYRAFEAASGMAALLISYEAESEEQQEEETPGMDIDPYRDSPRNLEPEQLLEPQAQIVAASKALGMCIKAVVKRPSLKAVLLRVPASTLKARFAHLREVLGMHRRKVVQIVSEQPSLLLRPRATITSRAQALADILGLTTTQEVRTVVMQCPRLLTCRSNFPSVVLALLHNLNLTMKQTAALVVQHPELLTLENLHALPAVLHEIMERLDISSEAASQLVAQQPGIVLMSIGTMKANLRILSTSLELDAPMLQAMVNRVPDLLVTSPSVLESTCKRFLKVMRRSEAWGALLPELMSKPRDLAVAISFDGGRYDRMDYLVRTLRDKGISFKEALTMSNEDFTDMYPGYVTWRKAKGM